MKLRLSMWNILGALALGLMAGFFIHAHVNPENLNTAQKMVPVVVADANLAAGTALRPEVLRVVQLPREILPTQTFNSLIQLEGRVVIVPMTKGEPILLPQLAPLNNQKNNLNIKKLVPLALNLPGRNPLPGSGVKRVGFQ